MDAKAVQNATVRASIGASDRDKARARSAERRLTQLHGEGFYFNALLNLLHRHGLISEESILAESHMLHAADIQRALERQGAREARGAGKRAA